MTVKFRLSLRHKTQIITGNKNDEREREADECAKHGEMLRWSSDSDVEKTTDNRQDR